LAEHPDVQRFQRALELRHGVAFDAPDEGLLNELLAADVVWHGAATSDSGEARGAVRVIALWNEPAKPDGSRIEIQDVFADGLHAIAKLEWSVAGTRSVPQAQVFHLNDDGKVSELWSLPTDSEVTEALAGNEAVPDHRNLPVFRAAEETRAGNTFEPDDLAKINAFLREDVRWLGANEDRWSEAAGGRDRVIGLFQAFKQATGGTIHMDLHGVFADDTHALSFVAITADRPDKPGRHMDLKEVNLFHLDAEGRAFEFWGVPNDPAIMDAFWAP
jgi:ketosteroid isomerase-like protein